MRSSPLKFHISHLARRLEASVCNFSNGELLVVRLLSRDDRSISDQREVNPGVGDQVGLELVEVDVKGAVEAEGSRDRRHDLEGELVKLSLNWGPFSAFQSPLALRKIKPLSFIKEVFTCPMSLLRLV